MPTKLDETKGLRIKIAIQQPGTRCHADEDRENNS